VTCTYLVGDEHIVDEHADCQRSDGVHPDGVNDAALGLAGISSELSSCCHAPTRQDAGALKHPARGLHRERLVHVGAGSGEKQARCASNEAVPAGTRNLH